MGKAKEQIHLIVDGFNVGHALGVVESLSGDWIGQMTNALQELLREIHDEKGWRVTIVWDGKGKEIDRQVPFGDESFMVLFAPSSMTADAVIEQMVSGSAQPESIRVATKDRAVAHSIEAGGAESLSPAALRDEVRGVRRRKRLRLKKVADESKNAFENRIPL